MLAIGRTKSGVNGFVALCPKIGLNNTDAEYVADLVNATVFVNVQQCSLSHGYMLYLHSDIFTARAMLARSWES